MNSENERDEDEPKIAGSFWIHVCFYSTPDFCGPETPLHWIDNLDSSTHPNLPQFLPLSPSKCKNSSFNLLLDGKSSTREEVAVAIPFKYEIKWEIVP